MRQLCDCNAPQAVTAKTNITQITSRLDETANRLVEISLAAAHKNRLRTVRYAGTIESLVTTYVNARTPAVSGKQPDQPLTAASSVDSSSGHPSLFVSDRQTHVRFLIHTGAEVIVISATSQDRKMKATTNALQPANGTAITTYGEKSVPVDFGL